MTKTFLFWLETPGKQIRSSSQAELAEYFLAEQTLIFRFRCFQYQECYSLHILLKKLHFLCFQYEDCVKSPNQLKWESHQLKLSHQVQSILRPDLPLIIQQFGEFAINWVWQASEGWHCRILSITVRENLSPPDQSGKSWGSYRIYTSINHEAMTYHI